MSGIKHHKVRNTSKKVWKITEVGIFDAITSWEANIIALFLISLPYLYSKAWVFLQYLLVCWNEELGGSSDVGEMANDPFCPLK